MTTKHFLATAILALAVILTAIVPAFAANNSCRVYLPYASTLSGAQLEAGRYEISWQHHSPGLTVTVAQERKLVATVQGRIEERDRKFHTNMVIYTERPDGSRFINEIRVGGTRQAIVFSD
jgi:hypothetical protein